MSAPTIVAVVVLLVAGGGLAYVLDGIYRAVVRVVEDPDAADLLDGEETP